MTFMFICLYLLRTEIKRIVNLKKIYLLSDNLLARQKATYLSWNVRYGRLGYEVYLYITEYIQVDIPWFGTDHFKTEADSLK